MTDLIDVVQKQDPGSELVELIELELPVGTQYFHSGIGTDGTTEIKFRDKTPTGNDYVERTYIAIPIELTGIERNADGASPRPSLTVANILSTFSGAIGDLTNKDLVGKRVIRRTTLKKYLVTGSHDSGINAPPIEFPSEKYIIDRIANENKISIKLELASVMDLEGVVLPSRIIVGKYCTWEYQGVESYRGGCTWPTNSKIKIGLTEYKAYFTVDDEPILPPSATFTTWDSSEGAKADDLISITIDGVLTKWRANVNGTDFAPSLTSSSVNWTRVRTYTVYNNGTTYTYDSDDYEYVESGDTIWRLVRTTTGNTPSRGSIYWVRGDVCGKILNSCKSRFQFLQKGNVTGATINAGGSGYTSAPTVTFSHYPAGVASVTLTAAGTGYTSAPLAVFTEPTGPHPKITATARTTYDGATGTVASITIHDRGTKYEAVPTITFDGGGGTGAQATATIDPGTRATGTANISDGAVTSITMGDTGIGYLDQPPTITFDGGGGTGASATAVFEGIASTDKDTSRPMPFGGFPGSEKYR